MGQPILVGLNNFDESCQQTRKAVCAFVDFSQLPTSSEQVWNPGQARYIPWDFADYVVNLAAVSGSMESIRGLIIHVNFFPAQENAPNPGGPFGQLLVMVGSTQQLIVIAPDVNNQHFSMNVAVPILAQQGDTITFRMRGDTTSNAVWGTANIQLVNYDVKPYAFSSYTENPGY